MKNTVIFDLDGTLADISHRLHHIDDSVNKDWDAFHSLCINDEPIQYGISVFKAMVRNGYRAIIITGRDESYSQETYSWLQEHLGYVPLVLMRPNGDRRPDTEVKKEWLTSGFIELENVLMAFEDRARVVQMYRDMGIPCYQVAEGDF